MAGQNLATRFLDQDQDVAFSFKGSIGDFVVVGFSVTENINAPFEIQVELATHSESVDLHALLDEPATLGIHHKYDANIRYFNGVVTEAVRGDSGSRWTFYSVTLRPSIHRLMHGTDCRIWQNKTVPDIVKDVFSDYNITEVDWQVKGNHLPREYCTQYRENHLAFIERLFAEEGIFYYFQHDLSSHRLIITDQPESLSVSPALDTLEYNATAGGLNKGTWVSHFSQHERLRSSTYTMRDYTFKKPAYDQHHKEEAQDRSGLNGSYDVYDYPGRYKAPDAGQPFTQHRMESVRVDATTGHGTTNNVHLCTGWRFSLTDHPDAALNIQYLLLSVTHTGQQPTALEHDASGDPSTYSASFVTMPSKLAYRPPLARKPLVDGPQMATVTGPAGEEIYCDEHGRVKVQFPWDRYGKKDEHSSCWIRVSQNWAGAGWGHIAIPRIGHEVIVDYLEGDPDQPIVTGRTYHGTNRPPYPLPANKTRMTIKSDTHKGSGSNELRFEDEADQEEVYMHAQKDHNTVIENDESHHIGHDRSKNVVNDQSESIGHDKAITVGNDHSESIGQDAQHSIGRDVNYQVGQNQQEKYGKDHVHTVGNIHKQDIYADHLVDIGRNRVEAVKGTYELNVNSKITNNTKHHVLMAFETFEIKGPGGKITIDSAGITLEAAKIDLKGAVSMGGSGSAQVPTLQGAANDALPLCEECEKAKEK